MARITGSKQYLQGLPEYDDFDPDLDIDVPAGYVVVSKDVPRPSAHPDPSKRNTIKWFNSFAVQDGNGKDAPDGVEYTVTMQRLPERKELFILGKTGPKQIGESSMNDAGTNDKGKPRIQFKLKVSDPPAGSYP